MKPEDLERLTKLNETLGNVAEWHEKIAKAANPFSLTDSLSKSIRKYTIDIHDIAAAAAPPKQAWDFLSAKNLTPAMMTEALKATMDTKANVFNGVMGGTTVSNSIAQLMADASEANRTSAAMSLVESIQKTISKYDNAFESYLSVSEKIARNLVRNEAVSKSILAVPAHFAESVRPLDILAGVGFANVAKIYEDENLSNAELTNDINRVDEIILNDPEVQFAVEEFVDAVAEARTYKKLDELLTDLIDKLISKIHLPKQVSHLIAAAIIFTLGALASAEIKKALDKPQPPVTVNATTYNAPKTVRNDLVIRRAPCYLEPLAKTRKVGTILENTEVEIIREKEGWCLVKGIIQSVKKISGKKITTDTLNTVWIHQRYLKDFQ